MNFASDNAVGAAPEILEAIAAANVDALPSYGTDPMMDEVEAQLRTIFECDLRAFLVTTGTAANALALASVSPPWGMVFCHRLSHIAEDECGAPEFFGGGLRLQLLEGQHGMIAASSLEAALAVAGARGVHNTQPAALSLTNVTEFGALYRAEQLTELSAMARAGGCAIHMDGTRFANAVVASNASPAEMSWKTGVDILCLGATKNGALAAEAVIFFDPDRQKDRIAEFEFRRKRGGHLLSKGRLLSAQMRAYLADDLWLRLARKSNEAGARLESRLSQIPGVELLNQIDANMLFARLPAAAHRALTEAGAVYYPDPPNQDMDHVETSIDVRLVCSPYTEDEMIDRFAGTAASAV